MEVGSAEAKVLSKFLERRSVREEESDRADVAVIRAPLEQGRTMPIRRRRRVTGDNVVEHKSVRPSVIRSSNVVSPRRFCTPAW
jgi:hypothetical protein